MINYELHGLERELAMELEQAFEDIGYTVMLAGYVQDSGMIPFLIAGGDCGGRVNISKKVIDELTCEQVATLAVRKI